MLTVFFCPHAAAVKREHSTDLNLVDVKKAKLDPESVKDEKTTGIKKEIKRMTRKVSSTQRRIPA